MKRLISISLVVIMLIGVTTCFYLNNSQVLAESSMTETELLEKQKELQTQQENIEKRLNELETDKSDVLSTKAILDEQMVNTHEQIRILDKVGADLDKSLIEQTSELDKSNKKLNEYYNTYKERVRQSYENSDSSYLSVVLGSGSFTDFIANAEAMAQITEYDNQLMDKMGESIKTIESLTASISRKKKDNDYAKSQNVIQKSNYEKQVEKSNGLILDIEKDTAKFISFEEDANKELDGILDGIAQIARDNAAKEQAEKDAEKESSSSSSSSDSSSESSSEGDKPSSSNPDKPSSSSKPEQPTPPQSEEFLYPVKGFYRITSRFGWRENPTGSGTQFHKGVDIGRQANGDPIAGQPIRATKSGKVIFSAGGWNGGGGEMISIDNGNNLVSTYMHMSARLRSTGDKVNQGDILGYVGTTGNSTGPHLHFQLMRNGNVFDPLTLFPNIKFIY